MSTRSIFLVAGVAVLASVSAVLLATLPPQPTQLDEAGWHPTSTATVVAGAMHVHTERSDGAGTMDEVAAAAARAGLQFVVFGDHGDGTRPLEPPTYRRGVLCIDGVEISTAGGHYLALDMAPASYPLAGEPRDVVEDVARLGGFGVVAHPTSAKRALQWSDWSLPFDGLEWLNADAEWRDETRRALARVPFDYLIRPAAALASLLDRPDLALSRWDALTTRRRVVAVAGADAHGRIDIGGDSYSDSNLSPVRVPSYDASFRTFSVRLELEHALRGDAGADGKDVISAIRQGRAFAAIDALAQPARLEFTARSDAGTARMGEALVLAGPVTLQTRVLAPPNAGIVLLRNGVVAQSAMGTELVHHAASEPATFRVEVRLPGAPGAPPVPWIVTNPIYVGLPSGAGEPARRQHPPARSAEALFTDSAAPEGWTIETDRESKGAVGSLPSVGGREIAFRYALRGAPIGGQYAALVHPFGEGGVAGFDRLTFRARASRAMRLEIQIRQAGGTNDLRWQRSVYLDQDQRDVSVFFEEMVPVGMPGSRRPGLQLVNAVLFVVDTNHTRPGTAGVVWFDHIRLEGS
jgi:hypothetical protein